MTQPYRIMTENPCYYRMKRFLFGASSLFFSLWILFVFQMIDGAASYLLSQQDVTAIERIASSAPLVSSTIAKPSSVLLDELLLRDNALKAPPVVIASSSPLASKATPDNSINFILWNNKKDFSPDRVVRVLEDDVVIKLQKNGLVSLAGLQFPKHIYDGDCASYSFTTPSTKLKQLLPPQTAVRVLVTDRGGGESRRPRKAIVLVNSTPKQQQQQQPDTIEATSIQEELLRRGYAKLRLTTSVYDDSVSFPSQTLMNRWTAVQEQARLNKVGPLYRESCAGAASADNFFVDTQFEPIPFTMRNDWGDSTSDTTPSSTTTKPKNPGDRMGCSDFETYEDALRWYEQYFPWYGDVAKLDRDSDGVPCPGLAHTKDPERYRVKIPKNKNKQQQQ